MCVMSDEDAVAVPTCQWLTAREELTEIRKQGMNMYPYLGLHSDLCRH